MSANNANIPQRANWRWFWPGHGGMMTPGKRLVNRLFLWNFIEGAEAQRSQGLAPRTVARVPGEFGP